MGLMNLNTSENGMTHSLKLRSYQKEDAELICKWLRTEEKLYGKEFMEDIGLYSIKEARKVDAYELMRRLTHATPKETGLFAIHFGMVLDGVFLKESMSS